MILMIVTVFILLFAVVEAAKETTKTAKKTKKFTFNKNAPRVYTACEDQDKAKMASGKDKNEPNLVTITYTKNKKEFKFDVPDKYSSTKKKLYEKKCKSDFKKGQTSYPVKWDKFSCAKGFKEVNVKSAKTGKTWKAGACK